MSGGAHRLRRAIFAACRKRGLDDAARHSLQLRVTGKASMTQMTDGELRNVLTALNGSGPPKLAGSRPAPAAKALTGGPHDKKLMALWLSGWHLGVVRDPGAEALASWMKRQTGLDSLRWAKPKDTAACIEALKDWLARDGGVDWSPYPGVYAKTWDRPAARVLEALWRRVQDLDQFPAMDRGTDGLAAWAHHRRKDALHYTQMPDDMLNELVAELGRIRYEASDHATRNCHDREARPWLVPGQDGDGAA